MLNPNSPLAKLMTAPVRSGLVTWIGLRPQRQAPIEVVEAARLTTTQGLVGDRYSGRSGSRHVTLIQAEHLTAIAAYLGLDAVAPELMRRNIVVSALNLLALKEQRFRLGSALLEMTGECHPCSRMEETFGPGGYNAVRGHGGITARVLEDGEVRVGDAVLPQGQSDRA
ncbi:MOSC domain protein [Asticcacaulis biprosthecium C19]|uniref:MOSC domain protein n=1 Tax=Asticcacaulis biprosthecium C19 TaxID=715226 RepID=F4QIF2_9CAUL|nr:MOSC domain-containing protein [Asticcacaulis biprosthecium]EGF92941.1 MOSC domain protein [Asticcacaulis biprosthecium C19]